MFRTLPTPQFTSDDKQAVAKHPYDMAKMLGYNTQNIFIPAQPDRWTPLVTQATKEGTKQPIIMAMRIGK